MPADAASGLADTTVLMLEDDPTMRAAVRSMFRAAGCENVLQTANGSEALKWVSWHAPDLILCDCQMPQMDGLTFLRELRKLPQGAETPVLMLTANQNADDAWEARRLKVAGWLVKPVSPQNVVAQAAVTLGRLPPRVPENLLEQLTASYEQKLPGEVAALLELASGAQPNATELPSRLAELYARLHILKGQAGTLGYELLGQVAGQLHDMLAQALRFPEAAENERVELMRLLRVGLSGMKLVADRRLRGPGGAAGARMLQQVGDFTLALQARLSTEAGSSAA
jgi:two-component system chemotaxis response regulator CheY